MIGISNGSRDYGRASSLTRSVVAVADSAGENVAEAIWGRFLVEATGSDRLEKCWIDCLRQIYPDLLITDLTARFIGPLRALIAERTSLQRLSEELALAPIDLPGWQVLSAVAIHGLRDVQREDVDSFVLGLSGQLEKSACPVLEPGPAPLDNRSRSDVPAESLDSAGVLPERWEETAGLVGSSETMRDLIRKAARAALDRYSVLLVGESGVGKEVVAQLIHEFSDTGGPFVAVNCAAIPETLFESELFGHVRGAFSGAHEKRDGLFFEARRGTLLLDEITEIPLREQAKILRVLQDGLIRRVGSSHYEKVDFRAIATSNRNLEEALAKGFLRRDLYYRLAVHEIIVPPLREHRSDIPELVAAFLNRWRCKQGRPLPTFSQQAMKVLVTGSWSGNVRELEHMVYRLASQYGGEEIKAGDIDSARGTRLKDPPPDSTTRPAGRNSLSDVERDTVARALAATDGNKSAAARRLGITRKTLYRKIRRYGIELS